MSVTNISSAKQQIAKGLAEAGTAGSGAEQAGSEADELSMKEAPIRSRGHRLGQHLA